MARRRPQTRTNDADRDAACDLLDSGLADGQLSTEEHRQRVEQRDVERVELEIGPSTDPTTRDAVEITIRVRTILGTNGTLTIDPHGNVLKQAPPA